MNFQSGAFKSVKTREKEWKSCIGVPTEKYKSNISEEVLLSTIHMCHNFVERTLPFLEFEREVLLPFLFTESEQRLGRPAAPAG